MKRVIVALIIGVAVGYKWGFGDGTDGRPSIVERTLDKFGTSKVKAAQEARQKRVDEAVKP
jgi:hypothetical protein